MHGSQIRLRDHLNSISHHSNSAHAVEHDGVTGADLGVGGDTEHTSSKPSTCGYLHVLVTYLLSREYIKYQMI